MLQEFTKERKIIKLLDATLVKCRKDYLGWDPLDVIEKKINIRSYTICHDRPPMHNVCHTHTTGTSLHIQFIQ